MGCYLGCYALGFIASPMMVRWQDSFWPFRIGVFMSPMSAWLQLTAHTLWKDTTWQGAEYCYTANQAGCHYDNGQLPGYKCGNDEKCFGRSGIQVMNSIGNDWGGHFLFRGDDHGRIRRDLSIMLTQILVL